MFKSHVKTFNLSFENNCNINVQNGSGGYGCMNNVKNNIFVFHSNGVSMQIRLVVSPFEGKK